MRRLTYIEHKFKNVNQRKAYWEIKNLLDGWERGQLSFEHFCYFLSTAYDKYIKKEADKQQEWLEDKEKKFNGFE